MLQIGKCHYWMYDSLWAYDMKPCCVHEEIAMVCADLNIMIYPIRIIRLMTARGPSQSRVVMSVCYLTSFTPSTIASLSISLFCFPSIFDSIPPTQPSTLSFPIKIMASPRDQLSPSGSGTRTYPVYSTNLSSPQHTSFPSHMTRPSFPMPSMNFRISIPGYNRESRPTAEDNVQPRFELFLLGEGEKKVTEEADTRKFSFLS